MIDPLTVTVSIIIFVSFISSFISSIVGFGGGMLLLGILALNLPVSKVNTTSRCNSARVKPQQIIFFSI